MSSYSSSIKTLTHGQHREARMLEEQVSSTALLIAMDETPDLGTASSLIFVTQEIEMVRDLSSSMGLKPVKPARLRKDVLEGLPTSKIFHFAGHGLSNSADPSRSTILLEDWKDNPLTVADFRHQNFEGNTPFLAYLSACPTGVDTGGSLADEGIHLISALQLAGFRHVIGTLWDVSDERCVAVAKTFYQTIAEKGMTDESVCLGLHLAVRALRDRTWNSNSTREPSGLQAHMAQIDLTTAVHENQPDDVISNENRGDRNAKLKSSSGQTTKAEDPRYWASFVHYGVY
jgi:CHAT domain-containing protein